MTGPTIRRLDVAVVMPVYNEEACIATVIDSWRQALDGERLNFRLIVLNDGSTDGTQSVLERHVRDPRIEVVQKANSGHGPTILSGYRRAVGLADWVFQVDSDGEISAGDFATLWCEREGRDAVFGVRTGHRQSPARWLVTRVSRLLVRLFYGSGVKDVNVPFRLMRAQVLEAFVAVLPDNLFAPNVIIAGFFARDRVQIGNVIVRYQSRKTGQVSIARVKLLKAAIRSAAQTIQCRNMSAATTRAVDPVDTARSSRKAG